MFPRALGAALSDLTPNLVVGQNVVAINLPLLAKRSEQLVERADGAMYAMKRGNSNGALFSSRAKLDELVGRIHAA